MSICPLFPQVLSSSRCEKPGSLQRRGQPLCPMHTSPSSMLLSSTSGGSFQETSSWAGSGKEREKIPRTP